MKAKLIKFLLAVLNSRLLNNSPCQYGYIGNVDAFSGEHLEYEDKARPGITVRTILDEAAMFKTCPMRSTGFSVIEDGEVRDSTIWDEHELRNQFTKRSNLKPEER